jgi:hypothetical protein
MANEIDDALKSAAKTIADYVKNVSELKVRTLYVDLGETVDFEKALPAAYTEIHLDGDSKMILPVRKNETGALVVDDDLFDVHQQNVATAIDYRAQIMGALLQTFKQVISS